MGASINIYSYRDMATTKPVHTLVLDTGVIIKNDPSVSTLLGQSENLVTVTTIISEIRDAATRSRVETTLRPFLTVRDPSPSSVKLVTEFARRTGDLAVLSRPDIQIIALAYEVECERNGGDWRLRRVPGQKGLNGAPPAKTQVANLEHAPEERTEQDSEPETNSAITRDGSKLETIDAVNSQTVAVVSNGEGNQEAGDGLQANDLELSRSDQRSQTDSAEDIIEAVNNTSINASSESASEDFTPKIDSAHHSAESQDDSVSDSEGWITQSNLKKQQTKDASGSTVQTPEPKTIQVAVMTTDFAMQNVILQMNLNLLSPSLNRVKHLKTFVLRCHACFQTTKQMDRQFCPRCGQPALTRVSCSTNANGEFRLHLKKNMQWNTRGDRYSIPKPVHGASNGRVQGGGKGGWGNGLILTEDQKEYEKQSKESKKAKERNLMDEDYLPSILTGDRGRAGGRVKVGAGRNVNAKKR